MRQLTEQFVLLDARAGIILIVCPASFWVQPIYFGMCEYYIIILPRKRYKYIQFREKMRQSSGGEGVLVFGLYRPRLQSGLCSWMYPRKAWALGIAYLGPVTRLGFGFGLFVVYYMNTY